MKVEILFRKSYDAFDREEIVEEFYIACKYFYTTEYRTNISHNSLVIGRYSVLPFYEELDRELQIKGSVLINNYYHHRYIADIRNWYEDVKYYTPKIYTTWGNLPDNKSYIVKGITNSRKFQWKDMMFAESNKEIPRIVGNLLNDSLISSQGIVVREYIPLQKLDEGINGLPISNEWRLFFYKENLLCYGFYWSIYEKANEMEIPSKLLTMAKKIAKIISKNTNFFVLDLAMTENNEPILIEINDGQMSGLSLCDPEQLYKNLKLYVK